jgi:hypothetical protein
MRVAVQEWQALSASDPPQSLRRRSFAATLAVSLVMVATVACVLLADRPKGFLLEQTSASDEDKYMAPLMSTMGQYSRTVISQNIGKIFNEKNRLASDKAAAAALDASPEFQTLKRNTAESEAAMLKAAAAARLAGLKLKAGLISISREHHQSSDAIAKAIEAEKASEGNLIRVARSDGVAIPPSPSASRSGLLKILAGISDLDSSPDNHVTPASSSLAVAARAPAPPVAARARSPSEPEEIASSDDTVALGNDGEAEAEAVGSWAVVNSLQDLQNN